MFSHVRNSAFDKMDIDKMGSKYYTEPIFTYFCYVANCWAKFGGNPCSVLPYDGVCWKKSTEKKNSFLRKEILIWLGFRCGSSFIVSVKYLAGLSFLGNHCLK